MQLFTMSHLCRRAWPFAHLFSLRLPHAVQFGSVRNFWLWVCRSVIIITKELACSCTRRVLLTPELLRRFKALAVWPRAGSELALVASLLTINSCKLSGSSSSTGSEAALSIMLGSALGNWGWLTELGDVSTDSAMSAGCLTAGSAVMWVMGSAVEVSW